MLILFWRYPFTSFLKDHKWKVKQKLQNSRNKGFSSFFRLLMERSGSGAGSGAGTIQIIRIRRISRRPKSIRSYGSGSGTLDKNQHKQAGTMYTEITCRPVAWITGPCPPLQDVCVYRCVWPLLPPSFLLSWQQDWESILRSSVAGTVHRFFGQVGLKLGRGGNSVPAELRWQKNEFS